MRLPARPAPAPLARPDKTAPRIAAWSAVGLFGYALVFGAWNRPLLALALLLFFALGLPSLRRSPGQLWRHWRLLLLTAWAAASVAWSPLPKVTSEEALFQVLFVAACLCIAVSLHGKAWTDLMRYAAYAAVLANVAYVAAFPGAAQGSNGLHSYFPEKNNLGAMMGLSIAVLWGTPNKRLADHAALLAAAALLVLSESKTSIGVSLALPLVFVLLWVRKRYYVDRSPSFGGRIVGLLFAPLPWMLLAGSSLLLIYQEDAAKWLMANISADFLTGRGELWRAVLHRTSDKLLTGSGLGVFWFSGPGSEVSLTEFYLQNPLWVERLAGADGGYIDVVGALGFVGLFLLLLNVIHAATLLFRSRDEADTPMLASMLMFPVLHNTTESTYFLSFNVVWMSFLIAAGLLTCRTPAGAHRQAQ